MLYWLQCYNIKGQIRVSYEGSLREYRPTSRVGLAYEDEMRMDVVRYQQTPLP